MLQPSMSQASRLRLLLVFLLSGLVLAACTTPPPRNVFEEITFQQRGPIKLDVRELIVEQVYQAPNQLPNVEHLFPVSPAAAAARWAKDRLAPSGPIGQVRYLVREASVTETPLKLSGGLKGAITAEQSERYDALIVVEIQIIGESGRAEGTATARAERSVTTPEDLTLNERERVWHKLTRDVMQDLDAQLDQTIKSAFFRYLLL